MKGSGVARDWREIDRYDRGIGWIAYPEETMQRASHVLASDGGAWVVDFVDAGFPSTVVSRETFRSRLPGLLGRIDPERADVLVVELGASPAEPYNGEVARDVLADQVEFTALTATDPYAVLGFQSHSPLEVDLVTGITANTTAGTGLVETLTGIPTINMERSGSYEAVKSMLRSSLEQHI
jgi:hypothetical protein